MKMFPRLIFGIFLIMLILTLVSCPQPNTSLGSGEDQNTTNPDDPVVQPPSDGIPEGIQGDLAGKTVQLQSNNSPVTTVKTISASFINEATTEGIFSADGSTLTVNGVSYPFVKNASSETKAIFGSGNTYYVILSSGSSLFHVTDGANPTFSSVPENEVLQTSPKYEAPITAISEEAAYVYFLEVVAGQKFTINAMPSVTGTFSYNGRTLTPSAPSLTLYPIQFVASKSELIGTIGNNASYRAVFIDDDNKYFGGLVENITIGTLNGAITVSGDFYYIPTLATDGVSDGYNSADDIWAALEAGTVQKLAATLSENTTTQEAETFLNDAKGKTFSLGEEEQKITATVSLSGKTISSKMGQTSLYDIAFVEGESKKNGNDYYSVWTDGFSYYGIKKTADGYYFISEFENGVAVGYANISDIDWPSGIKATDETAGVLTILDTYFDSIPVYFSHPASNGVVGIERYRKLGEGIVLIPALDDNNEVVASRANTALQNLATALVTNSLSFESAVLTEGISATTGTNESVTIEFTTKPSHKFENGSRTKEFMFSVLTQTGSEFGDGIRIISDDTIESIGIETTIPSENGKVGIEAGGSIGTGFTFIPALDANGEVVAEHANITLQGIIDAFNLNKPTVIQILELKTPIDAISGTEDIITVTVSLLDGYLFSNASNEKDYEITVRTQISSTFGDGQLTNIPSISLTINEQAATDSTPGWPKILIRNNEVQNAAGKPATYFSVSPGTNMNNEVVAEDFLDSFNATLTTLLSTMDSNSGILSAVFSFNADPIEGSSDLLEGKITLTASTGFVFAENTNTKEFVLSFKPAAAGFQSPTWGDGQP